MNAPLQDAAYQPERAIDEIADFIADPVQPADFPELTLRFRNDRAASEIGLGHLSDDEWLSHFGQFLPLPGAQPEPLALRYHGHQFRNYNPDIGDGRGFLFAQLRDTRGRLIDLGTKGSGQTPYSRFGDGRLTLKGAVREVLATEMLQAQGVPTSRTLSIIETGEALHRGDEPSPTRSAVLVRQNHGHIRIGSFQRLFTLKDRENLSRLVDYALHHYFDEAGGSDAPQRLLGLVVRKTAMMSAHFMAAGFVHGVLNSDNINITGESFDYGPWRWTPSYDPRFTAAYFDEAGLYAFARQPEAIHWDVAQLAIALTLLVDQDVLIPVLEPFAACYRQTLTGLLLKRLNRVPSGDERDARLVGAVEQALFTSQVPIDRFFFDWAKGETDRPTYAAESFAEAKSLWTEFAPLRQVSYDYWNGDAPESMLIDEVEALWKPIDERDDWSPLYAKIERLRAMGKALGN